MTVDGSTERLSPGRTIHIPAGVVHAGAAVGTRPGRRLLTFDPAGMERFFLEVGAPAADVATDPGAALAAARRHGWRFVD